MKNRLETLKKRLGTSWYGVADYVGISHSMIDSIRSGTREPGNKTRRLVEDAEKRCGIAGENGFNTFVENPAPVGNSPLERIAVALERLADFHERIALALEKLTAGTGGGT